MSTIEWVAAGAIWGVVALMTGIQVGRFLRSQREERCVQSGCARVATHEQFEGATTDGIPIVSLTCRRHTVDGWRR